MLPYYFCKEISVEPTLTCRCSYSSNSLINTQLSFLAALLIMMLLCCLEYEASNGSAHTVTGDGDNDENSPQLFADGNDVEDDPPVQDPNQMKFVEALRKNVEVL